MTIDQIQRHLGVAAQDGLAPPTRVVVAEVYRAGLRRRRVRRWFSVAAVSVTVAGVAGGAAMIEAEAVSQPAYQPDRAAGRPLSGCAGLASRVSAAVAGSLPKDLTWSAVELPPGNEDGSCAGGGLFWMSFSHGGRTYRLGFEGGTGFTDRGCDPGRRPVSCEQFAGGEVGHLDNAEEFGVLLSRERGAVYFFLGLTGGPDDPPVTTGQLSTAAQRVAAEVFP